MKAAIFVLLVALSVPVHGQGRCEISGPGEMWRSKGLPGQAFVPSDVPAVDGMVPEGEFWVIRGFLVSTPVWTHGPSRVCVLVSYVNPSEGIPAQLGEGKCEIGNGWTPTLEWTGSMLLFPGSRLVARATSAMEPWDKMTLKSYGWRLPMSCLDGWMRGQR